MVARRKVPISSIHETRHAKRRKGMSLFAGMASAYDQYTSAETNENYDELQCCWTTQRSAPLNLKQDVASPVEWVVHKSCHPIARMDQSLDMTWSQMQWLYCSSRSEKCHSAVDQVLREWKQHDNGSCQILPWTMSLLWHSCGLNCCRLGSLVRSI